MVRESAKLWLAVYEEVEKVAGRHPALITVDQRTITKQRPARRDIYSVA